MARRANQARIRGQATRVRTGTTAAGSFTYVRGTYVVNYDDILFSHAIALNLWCGNALEAKRSHHADTEEKGDGDCGVRTEDGPHESKQSGGLRCAVCCCSAPELHEANDGPHAVERKEGEHQHFCAARQDVVPAQ